MDANETKSCLNEIKRDIRQLIETSIKVVTKLDISVGQHSDLENRMRIVEETQHMQAGVNAASEKRWGKMLIIVVSSEILLTASAFLLTHFINK